MDERSKEPCASVFVSNNFHVLRGAILAKSLGLSTEGVGCNTAGYYAPTGAIRETIAFIMTYKGLLIAYFRVTGLLAVWYSSCAMSHRAPRQQ